MPATPKIDNYLKKHSNWNAVLDKLRLLLNQTELEEDLKWGAPVYMINGKNIIGLAAFKNHVALWFHQGVFLKDNSNVLISAKDGETRALRQWRFTSIDEIESDLVRTYIEEAIKNEKAGKRIKPEIKKTDTPDELKIAFQKDKDLELEFNRLTPGKQREYCIFIGEAKQAKTRLSRLEKSIALIKSGKGLYEKYKK